MAFNGATNVGVSPNSSINYNLLPVGNSSNGSTDLGSLLGAGATGLAGYLGNQSATNSLVSGENAGINTQLGTQQQLTNLYGGQTGTGNAAFSSLGAQLGMFGNANYTPFYSSPGYQFALSQGNQAIQRQTDANGSVYTPNELAMLSQYNTGYASQNYNNYISQLMSTAGLGAQGNQGLASGLLGTSGNISQLQQNVGNAQAGGAANQSGIVSNLLGKLPWSSIGSGLGSLLGGGSSLLNGAGSILGGGTNGTTPYSTYDSSTGTGNFSTNSIFNNYANTSGYDPATGQYSGISNPSFSQFSTNSGYDPTSGTFSNTDTTGFDTSNP
jgi:hypothetical protein